jgi:hypothetical protein
MVRMTFDQAGSPVLAWLQDAALLLARSPDSGASFAPPLTVDAEVCDCCQPAPLVSGDHVLLAFRDVVHQGEDDLRDVHVVSSDDGGTTWNEPVQVSDGSWRINACPINGPALAAYQRRLYIAWMDGRHDLARLGRRGDIWLASSTDGGRSFTPDVRINPDDGYLHTLPVLAVGPDGRLHLSWEMHTGDDSTIVYASSDDQGASFTPPRILAAGGSPTAPSIAVTAANRVYLAWSDRLGAHVRSWNSADGAPGRRQ